MEYIKMKYEASETYYGQCRCCLAAGNHRDITQDYYWNGSKEVYCDMFLDCFNVFMPTNINTCNLICNNCVERIRDASNFKKLIVSTEQQLMDVLLHDNEPMMLVNVPIPEHTLDSTIGFKIELTEVNDDTKDAKTNHHSQADSVSKVTDVATASIDNIEHAIISKTEIELEANDVCSPRVKIEETMELEVLNEDIIEIEEIKENPTDKLENDTNITNLRDISKKTVTEKMALIHNVFTILENSNITAFKSKTQSGFPCFYCRDIFDNFKSLRDHQVGEELKTNLRTVLKKYSAESLVVYADVTDLMCTLCEKEIANLKELKSHLVKIHGKKLYRKCTERVIPFKLTDNYYECQICNFYFETFGAIERHMNTHIRNYVCEKCGAGFVTMSRLKTHMHCIHKEGKYPCNLCGKMFTTLQRHRGHVDFVHKMLKKLKCSKCLERFSDYFVQQKHLVEVHGEKPIVYRCNVCSRAFNRRYTLSCHMKRRHLEQRDICCEYCMYTCYNRTELREHMLKHNSIKMFKCNVCRKTYSRTKTLKEHMKQHHSSFDCKLCNQTFENYTCLKLHRKTEHISHYKI